MGRTFTPSKLRNGNGGSCSFDSEKMLSARAAQMARQPLGETLATPGDSIDGPIRLDAVERLARDGLKDVAQDKPHWLVQLLDCFKNPFIILLVTLAIIHDICSPDDLGPVIIIGVMVAISVGLRFWQGYRSALAAERLKALVRTTATAMRRPSENAQPAARETPILEFVPNDLYRLSAGDLVPADGCLISSMTGKTAAGLTSLGFPIALFETISLRHVKLAPRVTVCGAMRLSMLEKTVSALLLREACFSKDDKKARSMKSDSLP